MWSCEAGHAVDPAVSREAAGRLSGRCRAVSDDLPTPPTHLSAPTGAVTGRGPAWVVLAQAAGGADDVLLPHRQFLGINGFIFLVLRKGR
ncbi:hypothetical protein E2C01_011764 [Portunus trituberculatus]|uniref:Uncharacterized protein n=1 Tax=Portunus trituberculatus TaxID=210409 RepID=A0A5B7DC23_PORTR|nr:hypothetical protein [Portunus trituberculatus]